MSPETHGDYTAVCRNLKGEDVYIVSAFESVERVCLHEVGEELGLCAIGDAERVGS